VQVVLIEGATLLIHMVSIVTVAMGLRMAMNDDFVMAVNIGVVYVLHRQCGEGTDEQHQYERAGVEPPHQGYRTVKAGRDATEDTLNFLQPKHI
jgi:hypothetical protein